MLSEVKKMTLEQNESINQDIGGIKKEPSRNVGAEEYNTAIETFTTGVQEQTR